MYWNITDKNRLIVALGIADKQGLYKDFLAELLTKEELEACVTRLKAMCMLYDGATYIQVRDLLGLSPSTISRLAKVVKNNKSGFLKIMRKFEDMGNPEYFD